VSKRKRDMAADGGPSVPDPAELLVVSKGGAQRVEIHAKPRASKSALRGVKDGALEVALAAPPVDGAANEELVRFLAAALGIARRDVRLLRGEGARTKLVEIVGLDAASVRQRLTRGASS
jgi:uncharacterized protein (TIGR00251 family)